MKIWKLIKDRFDMIYCINLDERIDRRKKMEELFSSLNIENYVERVSAVKHTNWHVWAALSHRICVDKAKNLWYSNILVLEDDVNLLDLNYMYYSLIHIPKIYDLLYFWYVPVFSDYPYMKKYNRYWSRWQWFRWAMSIVYSKSIFNDFLLELPLNLESMEDWIDKNIAFDYWLSLNKKYRCYYANKIVLFEWRTYSDIDKKYKNLLNKINFKLIILRIKDRIFPIIKKIYLLSYSLGKKIFEYFRYLILFLSKFWSISFWLYFYKNLWAKAREGNYLINISPNIWYIYFEIPKVACSTIKQTLIFNEWYNISDIHNKLFSPMLSPFDLDQHEFRSLIEKEKTFTFAFVRNPYSRILSAYLEKINASDMPKRKKYLNSLWCFTSWWISFLTFLQFIDLQLKDIQNVHWCSQSLLLWKYLWKIDFIWKIENFEDDFRYVLKKLEFDSLAIKSFKPHSVWADKILNKYYWEEEISLVKKIYYEDFMNFDYSFIL